MDGEKLDFKYIAKVFSRFFLVVLTIIIVINVMYHVVSDGIKQIETIETTNGSIMRTVDSVATLIRNEYAIEKEKDAIFGYTASDGQRLAKKAKVADLYEDSEKNRELIEKIDTWEEELGVLQSAQNLESSYTVSSIEKRINETFLEFSLACDAGDKKLCDSLSSDIRIYSAIKELKNGHTDYKEETRRLEKQISDAYGELGKASSSVKSDRAGYFYTECDGYEEFFANINLDSVTLDELLTIDDAEPNDTNNYIGKIVEDYTWSIIVPLSSQESMEFQIGGKYEVCFSSGTTLDMTAKRIVRKTGREEAFIILTYDKIPEDFSFTRYQPVSVCFEKFEGFKVPLSSIRYLDEYEGVYVLHGNVIEFRRVKILAVEDAYALCDASFSASDGKYKSLKFYDKIVVKGEGLYVGKIIN